MGIIPYESHSVRVIVIRASELSSGGLITKWLCRWLRCQGNSLRAPGTKEDRTVHETIHAVLSALSPFTHGYSDETGCRSISKHWA